MDGYTLDVHRTLPPAPANNHVITQEPSPAANDATSFSSSSAYTPYQAQGFHGYRPVYKPMQSILTITPEEIVALTNSPREDELPENKTDEPQSPSRKLRKQKGDSSPSPTSSQEERKGNKRKRSDQSMAEVGSIMEDMRQAAPQASTNPQRSLAEGEAAFLSLVMQAASSEPIDELSQDNSESSNQISASLPDQLLESFIVRAHAMKSGPDTPETEDAGSKKRKGSDDNDLDILQDYLKKKKDKRKDYGLDGLRRARDPSESSTKSEASSDEDQQSQNISKDQSAVESDPSDQPMADVAQPALPPPKRRPGRPPKPKFIVPIEIEPYGPRGRRSPRLQDKKVSALVAETSETQERRNEEPRQPELPKPKRRGPGRPPKKRPGNEELFSFNEESPEGEKAREQQRRGLTNGVSAQLRRYDYSEIDVVHDYEPDDEWISGQEDNDEDDWRDEEDEEDESWIDWDASSDGEAEVESTPEEQAEEEALVEELNAAEEIRAVTDAVRREEEELRRAIAVSLAEAKAEAVKTEPEIKVEPWMPAKQHFPLTFRRLRPPWLNAYQEFKARGISLEEQKVEAENEWKWFVAESTDNRVWVKVPPTVTTWDAIVAFSRERKRELQESEDRERKERREKRLKEVQEQLLQEAQKEDEEDEEEEDNMDEEQEVDGGADDVDEADDDESHAEDDSDDGNDEEDDGEDEDRSAYQRRRRKKKKDMLTQLLDCFKEKDLEKVLVVDAAARKRKPPRKYGIDEWYHRRG